MGEIQRADSGTQKLARMLAVAGALVGVALVHLAETHRSAFAEWISRDPESRSKLVCIGLTMALAIPTLGLGGYLWRLGDRIVRTARFPVPGTAVLRDTVVLVGDAARRRGRLVQAAAILLLLATAALCHFLWRLLSLLGSAAA
jgi:hypothetical protein